MKYKDRNYICLACLKKYVVGTNHLLEIYTGCDYCNNSVLTCLEDDTQIKQREEEDVSIITYRFNIWNEEEKIEYEKLIEKLTNLNYSNFSFYSRVPILMTLPKLLNKRNIKRINIYNKNTFKDQYISSVGRVHNWSEIIFPNENIKEGYYLIFNKDNK
ncbi:MAG: hypothetical protein L3I99_05530 [Sulfurimonas sp.]|nr:hypothetical protein [Sulfurimonas sp.]